MGFQNPQHGEYSVPTARCRRHPKQLIDLAQIANCFHLAAIHPYTRRLFEPMIRTSHSPHSGRAIGREIPRCPAPDRMLTNGTTSVRGGSVSNGLSISSRINSLPSQKTMVASKGSFRRNSSRNFARNPGLRMTSVSCRADVHGVVDGEFFGEHAWTKSPVSSNVDTSQENDQSHSANCCRTEVSSIVTMNRGSCL